MHYLHRIGSIDQLIGHPLAGDSWEGYVIEEIYRKVRDDYELFRAVCAYQNIQAIGLEELMEIEM